MKPSSVFLPIFGSVFFPTLSQGAIVIDGFSDVGDVSGTISVTVAGTGPVQNPAILVESGLNTSVIGGSRSLQVTRQTIFGANGAFSVSASISESETAIGQIFEFVSSPNVDGRTTLVYNGSDNNLSRDFSAENLIRIDVASYDFPGSVPLPITLTLESGLDGDTSSFSLERSLAGFSGFVDFGLVDFSGVNLSDVDRITVVFDAPRAADFQLTSIAAIPEPSSLGVLSLAAGMALVRRRRS